MAVSYQPVTEHAANLSDNLCRWDGKSAGHFEVWFLTLNQSADRRGFWFRYTMESPRATGRVPLEPHAALWAAVFDPSSPQQSFGLKREYGVGDFDILGNDDRIARIGGGTIASGRAAGILESDGHSISWDLSFSPNASTYHHIPPWLKMIARPRSFVCSPSLDARFNGSVIVDGREFILEDERGCQSHLWGRKQVDEWVWAHSNAFEAHPGTVFEGLVARQRRLLLPRVRIPEPDGVIVAGGSEQCDVGREGHAPGFIDMGRERLELR